MTNPKLVLSLSNGLEEDIMSKERLEALLAVVRSATSPLEGGNEGGWSVRQSQSSLLILPHNDPDPDAIASAVALSHLLVNELKLEVTIGYKGIIGRAENRALIRYLRSADSFPPVAALAGGGVGLRHLTEADLSPGTPVALVDTQPETGNNPWFPGLGPVLLVLDHHPWLETTAVASYSDVRSDIGATSTILFEYLRAAELELSPELATTLFYGIKTDTRGLSRGTSSADAAAYFYLQSRIDGEALAEIERAQVPAAYFKSFATTLESTQVYEGVAISYIGLMEYPDLTAEIADLLSRLEKVEWVICMGVFEDYLLLSVRTPNEKGGAGRLARFIVNGQGTAGGHGIMAGGQIPLKGQNPARLARELARRVLQYFSLNPDMTGYSLV
jgi:nanoRNase/pAp phosphatase (c-di-AMP/oligoRNAs hydrolase)